ncbi:MAG: hypothetical protein QOF76_2561, partial [Solirubrobacteraceae bacterium]|nr:hypothetical protein [Solirubrobacteraceae bacterium]
NPAAGAATTGGPAPATPPAAPPASSAAGAAGAGGVPQADLDRYAAQRRQAETLRTFDAPHLTALRRITTGRANRWLHPLPAVQDSVLAAFGLEAVGAAEGEVRAGVDASTGNNESADHAGMDRSLNWCGFYALFAYRVADIPERMRSALFHVDNVNNLFNYVNSDRTPAQMIENGAAVSLETYHQNVRGSRRRWWGAETLRTTPAAQLDMRAGDIVLLDNGGAPGPNHIQVVRSWDPQTRVLFTVDGNGGGYTVDQSDRDPANPTAPADAREARVEASTGMRLHKGPSGGHVGVGMHDLGDQATEADVEAAYRRDLADPALQAELATRVAAWEAQGSPGGRDNRPKTKTPRTDAARHRPGPDGGVKSRVYGIGRFSIVDFERHDYTTAAVGTSEAQARQNDPRLRSGR